jgi:hypothetical protein
MKTIPAIKETIKIFQSKQAFPQAPQQQKEYKKAARLNGFDYYGPHSKATYRACLS